METLPPNSGIVAFAASTLEKKLRVKPDELEAALRELMKEGKVESRQAEWSRRLFQKKAATTLQRAEALNVRLAKDLGS